MKHIKKFPLAGIAGLVLLVMAIFAVQLGLDNDAGWGKKRILLAAAGAALLGVHWVLIRFEDRLAHFAKFLRAKSQTSRLGILAVITIVFGFYIWYALPALANPESDFDYYARMAEAFKHGQTYLLEAPPQSLLDLSDPYDFALRDQTGVVNEFPIDVSLYQGKFYFYWGPAPSLFLLPLAEDQISAIKDKHIGLVFACGLFLYIFLFIIKISAANRGKIPGWFIYLFSLIAGLSSPVLWMLRTSEIYEAAIFGGQFFLIGGFYWLHLAFAEEHPGFVNLSLAGAHWAFALATRLTTWPVVFFGTAITLIYFTRGFNVVRAKKILPRLAVFVLPLVVGVAALGWYNYIRFESVSEFGTRYQLASVNYTKFSNTFSIVHIRNNISNYFTYPVAVQTKFPYLRPVENTASNERMAGLFFSSPWMFFTMAAVPWIIYDLVKKRRSSPETWYFFILGGSSAIMMSLILLYYYPATRFIEDFTPLLLLLTFSSLAKIFGETIKPNKASRLLLPAFRLSGIWSLTASLLLAMPAGHIIQITRLIKEIRNFLN